MMKILKLLQPFFYFFFLQSAKAQQPILKVAGNDSASVFLKSYTVEVKVVGSTAITTMEMQFCNTVARALEGELTFPMPDGVSISRYAIDINGKMREAVPVEKEKGQVVFENIERRNVDPGLLEKVEGNNFRTRIYPIPANGCRKIIIGYEQELKMADKTAMLYNLPLHFKAPIPDFNISFKIFSGLKPQIINSCSADMRFEKMKEVWTSNLNKENFIPEGSFNISIPVSAGAAEVIMKKNGGDHYFVINTFPESKSIEKIIPDHIGLVWDASLSGLNRDHQKEFALLSGYFKHKSRLTVSLSFVGYNYVRGADYILNGGNWSDLKAALEKTIYDGATNFETLKYIEPAGEYLFFTDGLHTYGNMDYGILPNKPVNTICASANANYMVLKYIAAKTGGAFINLNEQEVDPGLNQLTHQALQFLGIKNNAAIRELYPAIATPVVGGCSVAGISNLSTTGIILLFGYGKTIVLEKKIELNNAKQDNIIIDIEKIWAQKKIAALEILNVENKEIISGLGKKYGLITANTSLIVLDAVEDYVKYEIEPPAELMQLYVKLLKKQKSDLVKIKRESLKNAVTNLTDLKKWWDKYFVIRKGKNARHQNTITASNANVDYVAMSDSVMLNSQVLANSNGRGSSGTLNLSSSQNSNFAYTTAVPYLRDTVRGGSWKEVVFYMNAKPGDIAPPPPVVNQIMFTPPIIVKDEEVKNEKAGEAKEALVSDQAIYSWSNKVDSTSPESSTYDSNIVVDIKDVIPERLYLKALDSTTNNNLYEKYLELRATYPADPVYYFDVAKRFFRIGKRAIGLKILSNIADLNFDDHELYKMLGYQLKALKEFDEAVNVFKKVLDWRPQDPQSYRDYGLALADAGRYQDALDALYLSISKNYDEEIMNLYPGIEEITVTEINNLIGQHGNKLNLSAIDARIIRNLPVDIRVVVNWNRNDTDIDLWVTDPNNEKCYYENTLTAMGGKISNDFTRGYGPEQFMLKKALKGKYKVEIDYYGDTQQKLAGPTTIMAQIFTNYGRPNQTSKTIAIQMENNDEKEVLVGEFEF
jgi:tetratricopeptide (TPR) repeat protein